jgi:hypothetical protein
VHGDGDALCSPHCAPLTTLRTAHHTVTYAWTAMSDTSEPTQETPDLDAIEAEIAAIELLLERLDAPNT